MRDEAESRCPQCGAEGLPLLFGLPVRHAVEAAEAGELRLAGCFVPEGEVPNWACASHTWRDVADARGWDARLQRVLGARGFVGGVDLEDLDMEIDERADRWHTYGLTWETVRSDASSDKPAVSLRLEAGPLLLGELTLRASGEAEVFLGAGSHNVTQRHYDLRSLHALRECLYDLEEDLGLPEHRPAWRDH